MLFLIGALVMSVVATVMFMTIGESAPPFNRPPQDSPGDYDKDNADDRRRQRERKSNRERKQRIDKSQGTVSNMQPIPVAAPKKAKEKKKDAEDEQEMSLDQQKEKSIGNILKSKSKKSKLSVMRR